jgi:hypothetical protein
MSQSKGGCNPLYLLIRVLLDYEIPTFLNGHLGNNHHQRFLMMMMIDDDDSVGN